MRRREFITLLSGAATWPLAARAQQAGMPVVGFLHSTSLDADDYRLRPFRQGLKDAGFIEGENVAIDYRWADDQIDRLPALAAELVRRQVAVIVAGNTVAAFAAKTATTTIPIVFATIQDPVALGLVTSLARPDGNLTGINWFASELAAKRLELLRELVPGAARVALLVQPANVRITESTVKEMQAAAHAMGLQIRVQLLFQRAARPIGPLGDAPQAPRDICDTSIRRSRRADELWGEPDRGLSSDGRVCRSHPQGRQARRFAGRAGN